MYVSGLQVTVGSGEGQAEDKAHLGARLTPMLFAVSSKSFG